MENKAPRKNREVICVGIVGTAAFVLAAWLTVVDMGSPLPYESHCALDARGKSRNSKGFR